MTDQWQWQCRAGLTQPNGVRIDVTITVPAEVADGDLLEHIEIAGMTAIHGARVVQRTDDHKAKRAAAEAQERAPF